MSERHEAQAQTYAPLYGDGGRKSLFRVEWWLKEAEGVTKPERVEHLVYTREDMRKFEREEREKDRQYNVVSIWTRYER